MVYCPVAGCRRYIRGLLYAGLHLYRLRSIPDYAGSGARTGRTPGRVAQEGPEPRATRVVPTRRRYGPDGAVRGDTGQAGADMA